MPAARRDPLRQEAVPEKLLFPNKEKVSCFGYAT